MVTHSARGHDVVDIIPAEPHLDAGSCPSSEPKTTTEETNCPSCAENAHPAAVTSQIQTATSLFTAPPSANGPSAPIPRPKTRDPIPTPAHSTTITQPSFELDAHSPACITAEMHSSYHRDYAAAMEWQLAQEKPRAEWDADPWRVMRELTTALEAATCADGDIGPSRRSAHATAGVSAPAWRDSCLDNDRPDAGHVDYGGEDGNGDTTPRKNKDVAHRRPRTRVCDLAAESELEHDLASEDAFQACYRLQPAPTDLLDIDQRRRWHGRVGAVAVWR
ncbi:hypothetical protein MMC26_001174 [Xylographa opegraphella]|nr:hypothetical protein [Xylographa opegraphella]